MTHTTESHTHQVDPPWSPQNFRERLKARRARFKEAAERHQAKAAVEIDIQQCNILEEVVEEVKAEPIAEPTPVAPPPVIKPRDSWEGSIAKIVKLRLIVASYFNISVDDLVSARRTKKLTYPRHVGMYLGRVLTDCSYGAIAIRFGNRDHTVSVYAFNKIKWLCQTDWLVAYDVAHLEALFS